MLYFLCQYIYIYIQEYSSCFLPVKRPGSGRHPCPSDLFRSAILFCLLDPGSFLPPVPEPGRTSAGGFFFPRRPHAAFRPAGPCLPFSDGPAGSFPSSGEGEIVFRMRAVLRSRMKPGSHLRGFIPLQGIVETCLSFPALLHLVTEIPHGQSGREAARISRSGLPAGSGRRPDSQSMQQTPDAECRVFHLRCGRNRRNFPADVLLHPPAPNAGCRHFPLPDAFPHCTTAAVARPSAVGIRIRICRRPPAAAVCIPGAAEPPAPKRQPPCHAIP